MCLNCKLFGDELKRNDDVIDSLLYSMESRLRPKQEWHRVELKGVGDNDGYWEFTPNNN